jgi:hypothetical protein
MEPRVVQTTFPTDDIVIAGTVVDAPPDASADAAPAIQAAIDEAAEAGGGVVFLPAGRYLLATPITIKETVTVRGDWAPPDQGGAGKGTILPVTSGRGDPDGPPAITLERGSGLREVTVWYPEQSATDIVPYPWAIKTSETVAGDNYTVHNVTLVNPYQAIKVGPEWNELHTIRNVYGTPLKAGLWIDTVTDIGRLIEVDFSPRWWEDSGLPGAPTGQEEREALSAFLGSEGIAFDMGRSDWEYIYRIRARGYGIGFRFRAGAQGETNAVMFGSDFAACGTALLIERLNGIGLSATGCSFDATGSAVHGPASFSTIAQFNACSFGSPAGTPVLLEGPGALTFQGCTFGDGAGAVIDARQGAVTAMDCDFPKPGPHLLLGEAVRCARILGNRFEGEPQIVNEATRGDVQVAHLDLGCARPDLTPHPAPPDPRPANRELFVVSDFGASPEAEDNTAAFTAALQAAAEASGGTVYVPAGRYRFAGHLTVPTGVELRGVFDVPHHTQSGGSVLMPTEGRGNPDGTPFIRLEGDCGLRGLTLWWPEQCHSDIQAYPWAVQGMGPDCRLLDVTMGNAYQGVDFWSFPSDGHLVRYLAGGYLRKGLVVSKCATEGWIEDIQLNPHYAFRLPPGLPQAPTTGDPWQTFLDYQWNNLDGVVLGRCANEHLKGTFLYAAFDGLKLVDDDGGTNGRIIMHGTDAGSRGVTLEAVGERGVEFINAQIVHFGPREVAALVTTEAFSGKARLFNSQMWAGARSAILGGTGEVLIQQLNTLTGPFVLSGGTARLDNVHFERDLRPHITVEEGVGGASLTGNIGPGLLRIDNAAGDRCRAVANSLSPQPPAGPASLSTGWEEGEPQGLADTVATSGGGIKSVSGVSCGPVETEAHSGRRALRLAGNADDPEYSYAYCRVFEEPIAVWPDTVLSYWVKPLNERGLSTCVDMVFTDGSTLRDSGAKTEEGHAARSGASTGEVGQWHQVTVPLGRTHRRRTIAAVMVAYDSRSGGGPFEALFDDLSITSQMSGKPWEVVAAPADGTQPVGTQVTLAGPEGAAIRYTLDGTPPSAASPLYTAPIILDRPGLWDLRFTTEVDGEPGGLVFGKLYEVR